MFFLLLSVVCLLRETVFGLPPGFVVEPVAQFPSITDISILPATGTKAKLLVTSKTGPIHVWDEQSASSVAIANLADRLCRNGERGVGAALAHPQFEQNRFIYVYYTYNQGNPECLESPTDGPVNRCSRFAVHPGNWTLDLSSEQVLLQTPPLAKRNHNAGSMVFGRDGGDDYHLYITIGDAGTPLSERISQNTSNVLGTLVRLTPEGDIPSTNPFAATGARCNTLGYTSTAPCQEVFAWGLRNPFKMTADPNALGSTTRLLINDVGGATWEETSIGGSEFTGVNYGYPIREGPCNGFGNGGNNIGNCEPDSAFEDPWHFYNHRDRTDLGGGCITAGAMVPKGYWPAEFDNAYFFADFVFGEMYYLKPSADGGCRTCEPPTPVVQNVTFHSWERISSMVFAPNPAEGSLTLYFASQLNGPHTLFRIVHIGGDNAAPVAQIVANRTVVVVGEPIEFHGLESNDAEGSPLSYQWDFGDGSPVSNSSASAASAIHTFTSKGVFTVSLLVEDEEGGSGSETITITVGSPPTDVIIESPAPGTKFAVGDVFTLRGSAVDFQGNAISSSGLSWEVRQHHSTHWHPFLDPTPGNGIPLFPAPSPEDFLAATNSHLEILLTATDKDGLSTTVSQIVLPKTVWLNFETSPPGIDLYLDSYRIETPQKVLSWENHPLHAVAPSVAGDDSVVFAGWSDGGSTEDHWILVTSASGNDASEEMRYIARYGRAGDFGCQSFSAECIVSYFKDLLFRYLHHVVHGQPL